MPVIHIDCKDPSISGLHEEEQKVWSNEAFVRKLITCANWEWLNRVFPQNTQLIVHAVRQDPDQFNRRDFFALVVEPRIIQAAADEKSPATYVRCPLVHLIVRVQEILSIRGLLAKQTIPAKNARNFLDTDVLNIDGICLPKAIHQHFHANRIQITGVVPVSQAVVMDAPKFGDFKPEPMFDAEILRKNIRGKNAALTNSYKNTLEKLRFNPFSFPIFEKPLFLDGEEEVAAILANKDEKAAASPLTAANPLIVADPKSDSSQSDSEPEPDVELPPSRNCSSPAP